MQHTCDRPAWECHPMDACRPGQCATDGEPHWHCVCGLPTPVGTELCELCRVEKLSDGAAA